MHDIPGVVIPDELPCCLTKCLSSLVVPAKTAYGLEQCFGGAVEQQPGNFVFDELVVESSVPGNDR